MSGLRVIGDLQASRRVRSWHDVDPQFLLDQVLQLRPVYQGDPISLSELFARAQTKTS
jgi:hypothetical protein